MTAAELTASVRAELAAEFAARRELNELIDAIEGSVLWDRLTPLQRLSARVAAAGAALDATPASETGLTRLLAHGDYHLALAKLIAAQSAIEG